MLPLLLCHICQYSVKHCDQLCGQIFNTDELHVVLLWKGVLESLRKVSHLSLPCLSETGSFRTSPAGSGTPGSWSLFLSSRRRFVWVGFYLLWLPFSLTVMYYGFCFPFLVKIKFIHRDWHLFSEVLAKFTRFINEKILDRLYLGCFGYRWVNILEVLMCDWIEKLMSDF